jgi:SPP1 family predicted phage head-tail adaptor
MIPKKQIRIENWIAPKDAKGDAKERIEYARTMWADVSDRGGFRSNIGGQSRLAKTREFKIRFRPDWKLSGSWRVIYLGKRYRITNIERVKETRFNWLINAEG